ncbi:Fc.00g044790.m01.CDS01 [Cosmosporella sp. VM-42]
MANLNKNDDENGGVKRATEFHDAMLGVPGYADDSMFFVVRYVAQAKESLRECDFDEFMKTFGELERVCTEEANEAADGVSRYEKAQALKQKALEVVKDCPDLVRDFDRFTMNARAASRAVGKK